MAGKTMVPCKHPGAHGTQQHVAGSKAAADCAAGTGRTVGGSGVRRGPVTAVPAAGLSQNGGFSYTEDEWRKIAGPNSTFVTEEHAREVLSAPSLYGGRVYGLVGGEIVRLHSGAQVTAQQPERIWLNSTTAADIVTPERHRYQDAMDNIEQVASRDRVAEMLNETEFGEHFDSSSVYVNHDGSEATLRVVESFGYGNEMFSRGDTVVFDPRTLPGDARFYRRG